MGSRLMVAFLDAILDHRPLGRNEKMPPQIFGRSELIEVPRYASIFFHISLHCFYEDIICIGKNNAFSTKGTILDAILDD